MKAATARWLTWGVVATPAVVALAVVVTLPDTMVARLVGKPWVWVIYAALALILADRIFRQIWDASNKHH